MNATDLRLTCIVIAVAAALPPARPAAAAELKSPAVVVTVEKTGCGFIDTVTFRGRKVAAARAGFAGASVVLTSGGEGSIDSLFPCAAAAVLRATIEDVSIEKETLKVRGAYSDGTARVPFVREMRMASDSSIAVSEEADFAALDARYLVAGHSLDLPLIVSADEHLRMFAFGAGSRAEMFRMDMNDVNRGGKQLISAPRGHWPYWDIGGVLQTPEGWHIWKANHADTMAYPLDQGRGAPGWADYSELDWGLTVTVSEPAASAPWAIIIDARRGVLSVAPRPTSQPPIAGKDCGRRRFAFTLALHESSWPVAWPCELDFDLYARLLKSLIETPTGQPAPYVLYSAVGTEDIPTIIFRERIQPSYILRTLYRGDAWRMQARMRSIGKNVPRNQSMDQWEADAREYLDYIRKNGVPAVK